MKYKYTKRTKVVDDVINRLITRYPYYSVIRYTLESYYSYSLSIDLITLIPIPINLYLSN